MREIIYYSNNNNILRVLHENISNFRFYGRDSGFLKFKIYAGNVGRNTSSSVRRLVAFTFHPTDPFAISVQRTNAEYIVNLHIRNEQAVSCDINDNNFCNFL